MASYTADDWQAQLEEMLALQSIYAENFRCVYMLIAACTPHVWLLLSYSSMHVHASLFVASTRSTCTSARTCVSVLHG